MDEEDSARGSRKVRREVGPDGSSSGPSSYDVATAVEGESAVDGDSDETAKSATDSPLSKKRCLHEEQRDGGGVISDEGDRRDSETGFEGDKAPPPLDRPEVGDDSDRIQYIAHCSQPGCAKTSLVEISLGGGGRCEFMCEAHYRAARKRRLDAERKRKSRAEQGARRSAAAVAASLERCSYPGCGAISLGEKCGFMCETHHRAVSEDVVMSDATESVDSSRGRV